MTRPILYEHVIWKYNSTIEKRKNENFCLYYGCIAVYMKCLCDMSTSIRSKIKQREIAIVCCLESP